jgi:CTP synthase (UTP-ammonia lyase)
MKRKSVNEMGKIEGREFIEAVRSHHERVQMQTSMQIRCVRFPALR